MNRLHSPGRIGIAAALLLATCFTANAQRAALVQDVDSVERGAYQQTLHCEATSYGCRFLFQAVPAGRRREIRLVSCTARSADLGVLQFYSVELHSTATDVVVYLPPAAWTGPNFFGLVHATTSMFFDAGDVPFVDLSTVKNLGIATCTVVGHDIAL